MTDLRRRMNNALRCFTARHENNGVYSNDQRYNTNDHLLRSCLWYISILNQTGAYNPDSRSMYHSLTEKIERVFRFMDIFIVKICFVGVVAPPLIRTSVNYFVYDMRDESFYMPLPTMYDANHDSDID